MCYKTINLYKLITQKVTFYSSSSEEQPKPVPVSKGLCYCGKMTLFEHKAKLQKEHYF